MLKRTFDISQLLHNLRMRLLQTLQLSLGAVTRLPFTCHALCRARFRRTRRRQRILSLGQLGAACVQLLADRGAILVCLPGEEGLFFQLRRQFLNRVLVRQRVTDRASTRARVSYLAGK